MTRCDGENMTARVTAYCVPCMQALAREEEERCDRIFREFTRRAQVARAGGAGGQERRLVVLGCRGDTGPVTKEERRDEADIKREKRRCDTLFLTSVPITADTIPFLGFQQEEVVSALLWEVRGGEAKEVRERIREEVRRWHPDKFVQKLGERIVVEEREEVLERVKAVAQALNDYGSLNNR